MSSIKDWLVDFHTWLQLTSWQSLVFLEDYGRFRNKNNVPAIIPTVIWRFRPSLFQILSLYFQPPSEWDRWSCCRSPTAQFSWTKPDFLSSLPMDLSACGGKLTFLTCRPHHLGDYKRSPPKSTCISTNKVDSNIDQTKKTHFLCSLLLRHNQKHTIDFTWCPNEFSLFTDVSNLK